MRVRFAPSPTGMLHIGGLRTALFNYLLARQQGGTFVLRIEDTDQKRYVEGAEQDIIDSLHWAGLHYDEGPDREGTVGPYRQTERTDLYLKYAQQLIDLGHAYYAFDTSEEVDAMRARLEAEGHVAPKYDLSTRSSMRNSLTLAEDEVKRLLDEGTPYVIRLKVPADETISFTDIVRGDVSFQTAEVDDQVLLKSDGLPTYHLANVVDDHLMGISHVIRGEEWLPSTPKHILMYRLFGWTPPAMAHLPLILSPNGGKLSKRNAEKMGIPVFVKDYRAAGYEPEAVINFLAFLGWNPGTEQEVFSLTELVEAFELERVGSAGVQFSIDKLKWFNEQHLRSKTPEELARIVAPDVKEHYGAISKEDLVVIAQLMQERITKASDLLIEGAFFFVPPTEYDAKAVKKRWKADSPDLLRSFTQVLTGLTTFTADEVEAALKSFLDAQGVGMGKLMAPLRLAVSGSTAGPDLYRTIAFLGAEETNRRIEAAIERLG